jgi:riboflavin kinase
MEIKGYIASGKGKGSIFLNMKQYRSQFNEKLGFDPEYGTLNIQVEPYVLADLDKLPYIEIKSFEMTDQKFGNVRCWPSILEGDFVAVIVPEKSDYTDIIEVIAPYLLRQRWKLKDGREVSIKVLEGGV